MVMAYFKTLAKFRKSTVALAYITYIYFVTGGMVGIVARQNLCCG